MGRHSTETAQAAALRRSNSYRGFWECDNSDGWFPKLTDQLATWLHEKKLDADPRTDCLVVEANRRVHVRRHESKSAIDYRFQLEELSPQGTWRTEIVAHDRPGNGDWLSVDVENSQGGFASVPRIATYALEVLDLRDGAIEFRPQPTVLRTNNYVDFIEVLEDDNRHAPVIAAAALDHTLFDVNAFQKDVEAWTREVRGLAGVVVLAPDAARRLRTEIGTNSVAPGGLRVYLPGVKIGESSDALRHRDYSFERLATSGPAATARRIALEIRRWASERPLRPEVARVRKLFDRLDENRPLNPIER